MTVTSMTRSAARGAWARARAILRAYLDDQCTQRAAAISYYAFLSLFPLAILTVAIFGVVVDSQDARDRVVDAILSAIPLRPDRGRAELRDILSQVTSGATGFGLFGVAGLLLSASGAMGALRQALNAAWDVEETRSPIRGKLLDLAMVIGAGAVILVSAALTVLLQVAGRIVGALPGAALLPVAGAAALGAATIAVLLRLMPNARVTWADAWPAALAAALTFEALKWTFSFYLRNVARYSAVYDSLAAVVAFLIFLYLASSLFLLAAEGAADRTRRRTSTCSRG
jgi:membrane protein